ncbi:MAG: outer membrane protein assembly factor BamE [Gemmatimonadota bacterium]
MHRLLLALSFLATAASAQTAAGNASGSGPAGTVDPGMSRAQVIERLGKPATVRTYHGSTYLMYSNKCGKACGMQDVVILDHDVVVDAVFRSPDRHYTGTSSSPEATKPNARSVHNQPLAVPAEPPTAAERVKPGTRPVAADSSSTTHAPADSATTSTSVAPQDSARSSMSHPPADSASSSTSHPPTPPK